MSSRRYWINAEAVYVALITYLINLFVLQFCLDFQGCKLARIQLIMLSLVTQAITVLYHYSICDTGPAMRSSGFSWNKNYILAQHDPCIITHCP